MLRSTGFTHETIRKYDTTEIDNSHDLLLATNREPDSIIIRLLYLPSGIEVWLELLGNYGVGVGCNC